MKGKGRRCGNKGESASSVITPVRTNLQSRPKRNMYRLNQGIPGHKIVLSLPSPQAAPLLGAYPRVRFSFVTSELDERVGRTFVHHNLSRKPSKHIY